LKPLTILIADDSPGNLKLLQVGLASEGHHVVQAANGREALAILELESVDAVISDILMPSMDGFQLCREIRRSGGSYRDVPLILYTATYDSASDRALADAVGADRYILKPAPVKELIGAVQQILQRKTVRHASPAGVDEAHVLEQYNAALVRKLETRNTEAQESLAQLRAAHEHIVQLNQTLEMRVVERTAQLDAVNNELEAFSFSVSHDLQAPLRRIGGFVQLLMESAPPLLGGDNLQLLAHIAAASEEMGQLIESLLAFARSGRTEMHFCEVELDSLVDKAIADLSCETAGRAIDWKRSHLPTVHGDPILLRQVMSNLLSNAVKYTGTRDKAVIEISARDGRANETIVCVRDNGVGFDMRYAARLFGVFQRMHRADEFAGSGIGLANAQRIVTRHGGSIWADATVGGGAAFCFSLPCS
jgi:signal transduction histidine kinase